MLTPTTVLVNRVYGFDASLARNRGPNASQHSYLARRSCAPRRQKKSRVSVQSQGETCDSTVGAIAFARQAQGHGVWKISLDHFCFNVCRRANCRSQAACTDTMCVLSCSSRARGPGRVGTVVLRTVGVALWEYIALTYSPSTIRVMHRATAACGETSSIVGNARRHAFSRRLISTACEDRYSARTTCESEEA